MILAVSRSSRRDLFDLGLGVRLHLVQSLTVAGQCTQVILCAALPPAEPTRWTT